ncbi:MAG: inositol monophosphatase [Gemmatimonadetes bacterium]|nr:inositol monophosphatase [Gemmatimonadota bacterium]
MNIPHTQVEALLREAAERIIVPLWRNLGQDDVKEKSDGDLATTADTRCERFLASHLPGLIDGSVVLGEESVHDDPRLLSTLHSEAPVWVIDPLDGTRHFVSGDRHFAIMVCLLHSGTTIGAWIFNPLEGILTSAEKGCGAFEGNERLVVESSSLPLDRIRGVVRTTYLPDSLRPTAEAASGAFMSLESARCAGYNYPSFAKNELQFLFFYRTLVWDHAPGILIVEEAGGFVRRLDGTGYSPVDDRKGLLCATNGEMWMSIQRTLVPSVAVMNT